MKGKRYTEDYQDPWGKLSRGKPWLPDTGRTAFQKPQSTDGAASTGVRTHHD